MKVTVKGFLARKPELVYTTNGTAIWKTAIAVQGREKKDQSIFVEVLAFNGLAEAIADGLNPEKGTLVYIEGRFQTETYETKEGEKRTRINLLVDNFAVLAKPKKHQEGEAAPEGEALPEAGDDLF